MAKVNYTFSEQVHNLDAPREVVGYVMNIVHPLSVIDIGCGIGTWLKVFKENGISEIVGVDGDNVDASSLLIPSENFVIHNLTQPFNLGRTFDLAICLEVAEHLPEQYADQLIQTLTSLSETVLFSAAIVGQGGLNHVNEQPFSYWQEKFSALGYTALDILRTEFWNNKNVNWWYKQNMFILTKRNDLIEKFGSERLILEYVHPEAFAAKNAVIDKKVRYPSLLIGFKTLGKALLYSLHLR